MNNLEVDYIKSKNYIEYSFALPILSIFYEDWSVENSNDLVLDTSIIDKIADILNIKFDRIRIEENYWAETNNVEVFHGENIENFLFFDLGIDPYDQCNMVVLGVRLERKYEKEIFDLMLSLYHRSQGPCSNLQVDYFNQSLYRTVFNENFYFYKDKKYENQKLIHHYAEIEPANVIYEMVHLENKCVISKYEISDKRRNKAKFHTYKANLSFTNLDDLLDFLKVEYDENLDIQKTKKVLINPLFHYFEWNWKEYKLPNFNVSPYNFSYCEGKIIDWEEGKYLFYKENERYIFKIYEKEEQSREIILTSKQIKEWKTKKIEFAEQFYLQQSQPKPEKSLNIFQRFIQKIKNN